LLLDRIRIGRIIFFSKHRTLTKCKDDALTVAVEAGPLTSSMRSSGKDSGPPPPTLLVAREKTLGCRHRWIRRQLDLRCSGKGFFGPSPFCRRLIDAHHRSPLSALTGEGTHGRRRYFALSLTRVVGRPSKQLN
jgi:hypothetical protein